MALAKNTLIFLAAQLLALLSVCCGAVYKVGDSSGWTSLGSVDYQHWASTKTFHVGDTIVFAYDSDYHNVLQVTRRGFQSCNATSPIATHTSGSDSITFKSPGHWFFICGSPGHCQAGQKVDIRVISLPLPVPDYYVHDEQLGIPTVLAPAPAPAPATDSTNNSFLFQKDQNSCDSWLSATTTTAAIVAFWVAYVLVIFSN